MDEKIVEKIWLDAYKMAPETIDRLRTGNCHYVYKVTHKSQNYILRIANEENRQGLKASIYWIKEMENLKVPIPKLLKDGTGEVIPYTIMNYIDGEDLGGVYHNLSGDEKRQIALSLNEIQRKIGSLPRHKGYGYLSSYTCTDYYNNWKEVVLVHLQRSCERMDEAKVFSTALVDRARLALSMYDAYLEKIEPIPFLDDTTTKNVLIYKGSLSGIVDLDWVCFGDSIYVLALTKMALLSLGEPCDYIDYWLEYRGASHEEIAILDLYTAIFCLDFMSEVGMRFNRDQAIQINDDRVQWFLNTYDALMAPYEK